MLVAHVVGAAEALGRDRRIGVVVGPGMAAVEANGVAPHRPSRVQVKQAGTRDAVTAPALPAARRASAATSWCSIRRHAAARRPATMARHGRGKRRATEAPALAVLGFRARLTRQQYGRLVLTGPDGGLDAHRRVLRGRSGRSARSACAAPAS